MDWWVIEYDNKNFDSHVFIPNLRDEFVALMTAAGGGPFGTTVCTGSATLPDNKLRFYFNAKAASIPGVNALLSKYQAKTLAPNPRKGHCTSLLAIILSRCDFYRVPLGAKGAAILACSHTF